MQLMTRVEKETTTEKKDSNKVGLDFSYFSNNEVTIPNHSSDMVVEEPKKKPRKRKTTSKIRYFKYREFTTRNGDRRNS